MNKINHTPGPWNIGKIGNSVLIQSKDGESDICQIFRPYPPPGRPADNGSVQTANARLLAAAPDLLDKLQNLLDELNKQSVALTPEQITEADGNVMVSKFAAQAAIDRAEGRDI